MKNRFEAEIYKSEIDTLEGKKIACNIIKEDMGMPKWFKNWSETVYQKQPPQWFNDWNNTTFKPFVEKTNAHLEKHDLQFEEIYSILKKHDLQFEEIYGILKRNNLN